MTPDMINAIASLWKLVAALSVLFALFMLRKPIEGRLNELYCFKAKDTEVEFTADDKKELRDAAAVPLSPVEENSKKELIADDYSKATHHENWRSKMIEVFFERKPSEEKHVFEMAQAYVITCQILIQSISSSMLLKMDRGLQPM